MTTNTHVAHPAFIHSLDHRAERRQSSWWTVVAIVGLAAALLAMVVQPSYPHAAPGGSEDIAVLAE